MMCPVNWNSYFRPDEASRWTWVSSGAFYGESHAAALLKVGTSGEVVTTRLFSPQAWTRTKSGADDASEVDAMRRKKRTRKTAPAETTAKVAALRDLLAILKKQLQRARDEGRRLDASQIGERIAHVERMLEDLRRREGSTDAD